MKSSQSLETLYKIVNKIKGPIEAKNFLADVLFSAVDELQEEGLEITQEAIDKKLAEVAKDFLEVSKSKNNVA
jgi:hypothetical protein